MKSSQIRILASAITFLLVVSSATSSADQHQKSITLTEAELNALVDQRLEARLKELGLIGSAMDERIEKGILAFVEKRNQRGASAENKKAKLVKPVSLETDHIYGNKYAPVTLIEYSDFECPYCKRFHLSAKKLIDESGGKINWVYRHFPLGFHNPGAQKQAEATECAAEIGGNDSFWQYTDLIYERTKSGGKGFPVKQLVPLAVEIGLDEGRFRECLDTGKQKGRVALDLKEGAKAGITGTPGNILRHNESGEVVALHGARPYPALKSAVEKLLDKE